MLTPGWTRGATASIVRSTVRQARPIASSSSGVLIRRSSFTSDDPVRSRSKPKTRPRLRVVSAHTRSPTATVEGRPSPFATRSKTAYPSSFSSTTTISPSGRHGEIECGHHARQHEDRVGVGTEEAARDPAVGVRALTEERDPTLDAREVLEVGGEPEEEDVDALGPHPIGQAPATLRMVEHPSILRRVSAQPWRTCPFGAASLPSMAGAKGQHLPGADRIVVAALGDSITAGNPGWDPDPERRKLEDPGNDETSQYLYWAQARDPRLDCRNLGVGGERTDQIKARIPAAVAGADVLVIQGGINDIVQGRAVELAANDLRAMVKEGKAAGLQVVIAEVLPWNKGWPDADPQIRALNDAIRWIGDQEGILVLPFYETLEDPERPGRMRPEWTADENHPSIAGHRRLGELAFSVV